VSTAGLDPAPLRAHLERRELIGYGVYRGLIGHIDKHSPAALLEDDSPNPMVWDQHRQ